MVQRHPKLIEMYVSYVFILQYLVYFPIYLEQGCMLNRSVASSQTSLIIKYTALNVYLINAESCRFYLKYDNYPTDYGRCILSAYWCR